jgi:hypothetical protein
LFLTLREEGRLRESKRMVLKREIGSEEEE